MSGTLCPVCRQGRPEFRCRALLYPGCVREIHACAACQAAYYLPVPGPEDIARCYPRVYFRDFFKQYWKDYYKGRALALDLSSWKDSGAFLDVGCALGTMLAGVRDHSRWRVCGLELSPEAAALGRELNRIEIANAGLTQAPWTKESFNFLHMNNILEHESDPAAALTAAARLLKPGGRLRLSVPNGPVDLLPNLALFPRRGPVPTRHGGHLFFLSRRAVEILLDRSGLKPLFIRCFHFKLGMKARGWLPGSYKPFLAPAEAPQGLQEPQTLAELRGLIPPPPSWPLYRLGRRWRRLWRSDRWDFGYDFEVLAEKI